MGSSVSKSQEFMEQRERSNTEHRKQGTLAINLVREEFNRSIQEVYDLRSGELLGKGGFGTVRVVTHKETKNKYALKTIELKDVETHEQYEFLLNEIEIMKKLDHPNIARVQEVFHTPDHLYMVMDLYTGGDLYDRYKLRSEDDTAKIVNKLVNALRYCHDRNVAHRDIKLENVCFESEAEDAEVKLVDFGLSASFKDEQLRHDLVGSWVFMAPEVLQRAHHPQACDLWSMGIITYCLLAGYPPFRSDNLEGLKQQILNSHVSFHGDAWAAVSDTAKDFIRKLLKKDPKKRLTAQQAQQHPWLQQRARYHGGVDAALSPKVVDNLLRFKNLNLMKRVALGVVARTLEASEMRNLEQEFHKADVGQTGVISIEDFRAILMNSNQFNRKEVDDIFDGLDIQSSGQLSYTDFTAAALDRHQLDKRRLKYAFERLDHDNNGELDYEDLLMTVGSDLSTEDVRTAIKQFDTKGNGRVTFADFCKGMRSVGSALDALSTAQLTSGYMRDSIAKGEGAAALAALKGMNTTSPSGVIRDQFIAGMPSSTSGERPLDGQGATGDEEESGSSSETASLSRPQSLERNTAPLPSVEDIRTIHSAEGETSAELEVAATIAGGAEAASPPRPLSVELSDVGGDRVKPSSSSSPQDLVIETRLNESTSVAPLHFWAEGMRGSLEDRRMRDSLRLHRNGALTPTGMAGLSIASSSALGAVNNTSSPAVPVTDPASLLIHSRQGTHGSANRLATSARSSGSGSGSPAPPSVSGGVPAAGQNARSATTKGWWKSSRTKPAQESGCKVATQRDVYQDLPSKDSTVAQPDLGWGTGPLPADYAAADNMRSESPKSSTPRTPRMSRERQSLRFSGVHDEGMNGRGNGHARRGSHDPYRSYDSVHVNSSSDRRRKTMGLFCTPENGQTGELPDLLKWLDGIFCNGR